MGSCAGYLENHVCEKLFNPGKIRHHRVAFQKPIENCCEQHDGQKVCMTKRKTTAAGLSKVSGQDGKPSAALPAGYASLLTDLKARIRAAQLRAAVSVNRELILLYWDIGKIIVESQKTKGYGKQVVERLRPGAFRFGAGLLSRCGEESSPAPSERNAKHEHKRKPHRHWKHRNGSVAHQPCRPVRNHQRQIRERLHQRANHR